MSLLAALAAAAAPRRPAVPADGPARNIAGSTEAASLGKHPGNRNGFEAVTTHAIVSDAVRPTLEWVVHKSYGPEAAGTFAASYQINGGPKVPVRVKGSPFFRLEVMPEVQVVTSDPIPDDLLAGDVLTITSFVDADGETGSVSSSYTGPDWQSTWALRPTRVVAPSSRPSFLCAGDSIAQQADSFPGQACRMRGLAHTTHARGGDGYVFAPEWRFAYHEGMHTGLIDQYGTNDHDRADKYANALRYWKAARAAGFTTVVKTTVTAAASSTDGYKTLEGQTPARQPGITEFNRWLRDGAPITADLSAPLPAGATEAGAVRCKVLKADGTATPASGGAPHPLTAVSDVAAAIESSQDSGKYAIGQPTAYYGDGTHPGAGMHTDLAKRLARDLAALGF